MLMSRRNTQWPIYVISARQQMSPSFTAWVEAVVVVVVVVVVMGSDGEGKGEREVMTAVWVCYVHWHNDRLVGG